MGIGVCDLHRIVGTERQFDRRDYRRDVDLAVDGTDYGDRALGRNQ